MPYSSLLKLRTLLGDPAGVMISDGASLTAQLNRGRRDLARRGYAIQKRETIALTANTRVYTLADDHVQTFAFLVDRFQVSIRLLSQDGHIWWLRVSPTGARSFTDVAPVGQVLLGGSSVYWLQLTSPDATLWYVYPGPTGLLTVRDVQPATGPGTSTTVQLRDAFGVPWYLRVSNTGVLAASQTGTATISGDPLDEKPLTLVAPEAILRIDPREETGKPKRYAIMGKLLLVAPTPNLAYQLKHFYFADDVAVLPNAWQHIPLLWAAATEWHGARRPGPGAELLGIYGELVSVLRQNLDPSTRDGKDLYTMPPR